MGNPKETLPATVTKKFEKEGDAVLKPIGESLARITERVYGDGLEPSVKAVGAILGNVIAMVGLLPLFARMRGEALVAEALARVPEERRVPAPLQLLGPTIEGARYHEPGDPLYEMFSALLTKGFDGEEQARVHPSFPGLVARISSDEARIINLLHRGAPLYYFSRQTHPEHDESDELEPHPRGQGGRPISLLGQTNWRRDHRWEGVEELHQPKQMMIYYEHLEGLGLVRLLGQFSVNDIAKHELLFAKGQGATEKSLRRIVERNTLGLTGFGRLFAEACIPEDEEWDW